jgi:ecotin
MRLTALAFLTLLPALAMAAATPSHSDLKPYPAAPEGYSRLVIDLPQQDAEDAHKLELIAGKTLDTDCNQQWFSGQLEERSAEGWGYPYYHLSSLKGPMTTLMACPPGSGKPAFVPVRGEGFLLRYNSKLPVVIYVPQGTEVRYRLWSAGDTLDAAPR